jgi:hypothetical protein
MPSIDLAIRAQVVALRAVNYPDSEIHQITGVSPRSIRNIYERAIKRGFDPSQRPQPVLSEYVADAPRSGRPGKQAAKTDEVLSKVRCDRFGREKSCEYLAKELGNISSTTV